MKVKNLDTDFLVYSNDEVFATLRHLSSAPDDEYLNSISRVFFTSTLINHITNIELLFNAVRLLKSANLLSEYDDVFAELKDSVFTDIQYSETDIVRILSFVVAGLLEHEICSKILNKLSYSDVKRFKYGIKEREVHILFDLEDFRDKIKKISTIIVIKDAEKLKPIDREKYLYKIVSHLQTLKYNNETSYFDNEIEHFDSYLKRFSLLDFPIQKAVKETGNKDKYKALKDIFENNNDFASCINELRLTDPPVINNRKKYLLGTKKVGSIVAWIDALYFKGLIVKPKDDVLASLLVDCFDGFSISGRSLRANQTKAYDQYYNHFRNALPQPKK